MSKLSEFYTIKSQIFEGEPESEAKWDAVEDKLIREELLPELVELIKPVIGQVKSPLSLQINYDPSGNLAVMATRNCIQTILPMGQSVPVAEVPKTDEMVIPQPEPDVKPAPEEPIAEDLAEDADPITRAKSVGFRVIFKDGTVIAEKKAVDTFIKALQKIGLLRLAKGNHGAEHANFRLVGTEKRESDTKKQALVDGYYIYTHMSNEDKIDDLMKISKYYNLGLRCEWVESMKVDALDEDTVPVKTEKTAEDNSPEARFRHYLEQKIESSTVRSYLSAMTVVSDYINREVDNTVKSIYDITDVHLMELCSEMLGQSEEYVAENDRRHHQLSAALNKYIKYLAE